MTTRGTGLIPKGGDGSHGSRSLECFVVGPCSAAPPVVGGGGPVECIRARNAVSLHSVIC